MSPSMLDALLPWEVATVETTAMVGSESLLAEEATALGHAAPKRAAEFATGRSCARLALRQLGVCDTPIPRGSDREPIWPAGVAGSITHCAGYCAAAVARASAIWAIGIDAEPDRPLPGGILERIARPEEARWVRARGGAEIRWDTLLFSAKESVFKAWFPLTRRWLEFDHARVSFAPEAGTFDAELLVSPLRSGGVTTRRLPGRFKVADGLLLTAIALPAPTRTTVGAWRASAASGSSTTSLRGPRSRALASYLAPRA